MPNITFIPRKFKNIETDETVDFDEVVNSSQISVILGEPASGKTYQLENYAYNNGNATLLEALDVEEKEEYEEEVLVFDSIDEALINYPKIRDYLKRYIKKNKNKKFVITCRYLEWKEKFEEDLKKIDKDLRVYEISPLDDEDINILLEKSNITINNFWNFVEKNHLSSLLKNIMVLQKLIENFNKKYKDKEKINYTDIYEDIVDDNIKLKGANREDTKRRVEELLPTASSLATYMTLNRKDIISKEDIDDSENFVDKLYKINNDNIKEENFQKTLNSGLFEKKENNFTFFHKSIQEYLTAYFINFKKLDTDTIKEIFSHDLRFYEEFEEVIIYLTNIQPELFDDFVKFDPFIFRRHPSLDEKQQEKLLLSILDKLQNSESYAWDRVNFFYGSSLVKFDKIDVYLLIKEKIKDNQSDILLQYIMRVFAENHLIKNNEEFEDFIFQKLNQLSKDPYKCQQYISYSYNFNYNYNKKLFDFMQENKLLQVATNPNNALSGAIIGDKDNPIVKNMFLVLYGCKFNNYNKIEKIQKSDFDFKNLIFLLNYIKLEKFQEFTYWFIKLEDIKIWTKYLLDNFEEIEKDGYILDKNIAWMFFLIFSRFDLSIENLAKIINFIDKYRIFPESTHYSTDGRTELSITNQYVSILFSSISENFWELYFSNKISIEEVTIFLRNYYTININDIRKIINKYPIEDYFLKVFDLIEKLDLNDNENIAELYFPLKSNQRTKILEIFNNNNKVPAEYIFKLLRYDYWKELENLVFKLLEKNINDKEKCRKYIELSYNKNYDYNIRLFDFMKKNNLFKIKKKPLFLITLFENNKDSDFIAKLMYEIFYLNNMEQKLLFDKWLYLLNYITKEDFYHIIMDSKFKIEDIESFLKFINENNEHLGTIIFRILTDEKKTKISLEDIINLFKKYNLSVPKVNMPDFKINTIPIHPTKDRYMYPLFYTISKEFWSMYFSDKIKNVKDIENFISLYNISEKDIRLAIKQYPIEDYIEKYYSLAIKYNFIDILISNKEYSQYIEKKQKGKDSLDYLEQRYLNKIIQREEDKKYLEYIKNYSNENILYIFNYALKQNNNKFKETDKQLREDLQENYETFINFIIKNYSLLNKEYYDNCSPYNQWIFNYLFNILLTKEAIDYVLKSDENYEKLFTYIILGCISTENRELFKVVEDKFELFLNVVKEFIELISEKENSHCFNNTMKYKGVNRVDSFCHKIIDIFAYISFDKKQKIWQDFLEYIKIKKEKQHQYRNFFELIYEIDQKPYDIDVSLKLIQENSTNSFSHFEFVFNKDINKALEYFYKYIYDPISKKMNYTIKKPKYNYMFKSNVNHLYNRYLASLKDTLSSKNQNLYIPIYYIEDNRTENEKKLDEEKELKQELLNFYKEKNCSFNVVKIILFDKLMKLLSASSSSFKKVPLSKIHKSYLRRILIDYYDFYKEQKVPTAKDYSENSMFSLGKSQISKFIINIWGYLQSNIEHIEFLEELKQNGNKHISNSIEYCLLQISEKQGRERNYKNDYYKEIFNKVEELERNNITNNNFYGDIYGIAQNHGVGNQTITVPTINSKNDKTTFNYEKLLDDLIIISKQILKKVNSIKILENPINDEFISGLELLKYNVAGESRANHGNERDIIIKDENQSEKAIIEALKIDSIKEKYIKEHYDKLIGRYDVMGHSTGYMLIYVDNKNFEDRWEGYKKYLSEFTTFEDTNISDVSNIKVGKNCIDDKIIYHIFINFYSS